MKLDAIQDISNLQGEEFERFMAAAYDQIREIINGRISFTDNIASTTHTVTFESSGVDVEIKHGLGKIPTGYLVIGKDGSYSVIDGSNENTTTSLYVQATGAGTAKIIVI